MSGKNTLTAPFAVGLYSGKKKPSRMHEYLDEFVCDSNEIVSNGLLVNGIQ